MSALYHLRSALPALTNKDAIHPSPSPRPVLQSLLFVFKNMDAAHLSPSTQSVLIALIVALITKGLLATMVLVSLPVTMAAAVVPIMHLLALMEPHLTAYVSVGDGNVCVCLRLVD